MIASHVDGVEHFIRVLKEHARMHARIHSGVYCIYSHAFTNIYLWIANDIVTIEDAIVTATSTHAHSHTFQSRRWAVCVNVDNGTRMRVLFMYQRQNTSNSCAIVTFG